MRALVVLPLLLAALAGCLGDGASDGEPAPPVQPEPEALRFLPPVTLGCPDYPHYVNECDRFGEPQLEVQGDGTIWYSAVCCVGQSPPIWRSFDGGLTFEPLPLADGTGATRDAFGIEGDFAVDDAGNVYFFDISAATAYLTKYAPDGTHVHTKPDVFPPLVDRPWVRAGAEDEVFIAYNGAVTGSWFYRSTDGGLTFELAGGTRFPCGLAGLGQGADRDHLLITACSTPTLWQSFDGGITWEEPVEIQVPGTEVSSGPVPPAFADDNGTAYVPMVLEDGGQMVLHVAAVEPDGTVRGPWAVSPAQGLADYPWLAAGAPGHVAVAYYASDNGTRQDQAQAQWHLRVAYTTNADDATPDWTIVDADPHPVHNGTLGRSLGDFLQMRHAENGDLVIAYAARVPDGLENRFVRSQGIDMGHATFRNGPPQG